MLIFYFIQSYFRKEEAYCSEGCDYIALKDFKLDKLNGAQDFAGLTIAACTGDPGLLWIQEFRDKAGVEATFVPFGSIAESVTAVQKGECAIEW